MGWPTLQDYREAVQSPKLVFADPELQAGRAEVDALGLPRPRTGGFASVYKVRCGPHDWAVRCFLRDFVDQRQRYAAISYHLAQVRLPWTVGFTFLNEGIRVHGHWYPILKMQWVQGEPLNVYIERNLVNPEALLSLARQWIQLVASLRQASIAHGDLQHGNVLVVKGELRLIDYDGMYVPTLSGQVSHEVGHRNYQHPLRTESDFGSYLDNFSAWVVYVSLIALAVSPGLWSRFRGGDETLLFRRIDFEQPEASEILNALQRIKDEGVQSATTLFKSLLYLGPKQVPSLDGTFADYIPKAQPVRSNQPPWLEDHIKPTGDGSRVSLESSPQLPDPSWILDSLAANNLVGPTASFKRTAIPERVTLALSALVVPFLILTTPQPATSLLRVWGLSILFLALGNIALWTLRYRSEPVVGGAAGLKSHLQDIRTQIRARARDTERADAEKRTRMTRDASLQARVAKDQKVVESKEHKELDVAQKVMQVALSSLNDRRRSLNQQEADAIRKSLADVGGRVATLTRQIDTLTQSEAAELTRTLRDQQTRYMTGHLRGFTLTDASISGLGPVLKSRLRAAGFHTAADIDVRRVQVVEGIGWSRAASLGAWRTSKESQGRASTPQVLSPADLNAIQSKYRGQRLALEADRSREQQRQRDEERAIRARSKTPLEQLDAEEKTVRTSTQRQIDDIKAKYSIQYRSFHEELVKIAEDTATSLREIEGRLVETRKELFRLHWEKERLRRDLRPFDNIRFSKYLKRVVLGSRAA